MIRRPPRSTLSSSSAASDVYKRQAGGHTALPIVGQFYSQILHQSKFQNIRMSRFESPSEESLEMMDIPPYREIIEVGLRGFFRDLFGERDGSQDSTTELKDKNQQDKLQTEEQKPASDRERKPFWQSMKDIFKKKSK